MLVPRRAVRRFVLLFPGRSGGTFLAVALDRAPSIRCKPEPLGMLARQGPGVQTRWIDRYYRAPLVGRHRAIGLSTKIGDLEDPDRFAETLRHHQARVVVLDRRNDVKHAVSIIRAQALNERTGHWNRRDATGALGPIRIEPEDLDRRLTRSRARKEETRRYAAALGLPLLAVEYGEIVRDPNDVLARICAHIGIAPVTADADVHKATSDDLRDAVENFDDLRSRYRGTEFESMFDEASRP